MIKNYHLWPCALGLLAMSAWGCAAPVAPEDPNQGESGSSGNGPNGGGGSGGSDGGSGGGGSRPDRPIENLPGIDELDVPPAGCLDGPSASAVSLGLDAEVPSVVLAATDGTLHANGVACTSGGADIPVSGLTSLTVTGDGADEGGVILDLGSGDWSALTGAAEGLQVSFASGDNTLLVRGTAGDDFLRHAMRGTALLLDLVGDGRINVVADGITTLAVALAAGDDKLDDFAALLAEREPAVQAAAEGDGAEAPADGEEAPAIAALSLPLVAEGGEGNDWLLGGTADDHFDGGPGDDVFSGLAGDDSCYSAVMDGSDIFNGGAGYDYISYEERNANLEINACASDAQIGCAADECSCQGAMSGEPGENDRIVNVEDISAGSGDDVLRGSEAADSLSGGPGDDSIFGLGGSDLLYGEGGDDIFDGGADGDYCANFGAEQASGCEL